MEQTKRQILQQIARVKHKLRVKQLLETAALGLLAGACVGAVLALFSVFRPVPYLYLWEGAILAAGSVSGLVAGLYKFPTDRDAAKRIDAFGLKERVMTALELQDREDALAGMQRQDTLQALGAKKEEIRIPVFTKYKRLLLAVVMIGIAVGLSLIPSPAKKEARDREQAQLLVKETQKEIKKAEDALGQIPESELTEEQKKQLEEMRQLLAESKASLGKVKTPEQAGKESAKAEYNFAEMSKQLVMMAQNSGSSGAKQLEQAAKQIDDEAAGQMAQNGNGENGQNPGGQNSGGNENGSGENQNGNGSGDEGSGGNEAGSGDESGSKEGNEGNENGSGEQNGSGKGGSDDKEPGNESGNGGSGNGQGDGSGGTEGNGSGSGNGNGDGSGGGNSDGGADGQGGSGQADFGSGTGQHDYVSVPKETGDDENLTGKNQGEGESDIYRQQNGLSWEGEHVDGQAVIKEYAKKAYDGISRGEYPEGMEDVIKQYFNGF